MALSPKMMLRQGQSLVMTPQLLQAIKLLQFSNIELAAYLDSEIERNPLLERADDQVDRDGAEPTATDGADSDSEDGETDGEGAVDWCSEEFAADRPALDVDSNVAVENSFDDGPAPAAPTTEPSASEDAGAWTGVAGASGTSGGGSGDEPLGLEAYVAARPTLREHLGGQLALVVSDPVDRAIGQAIIEGIDESGYLIEPLEEIAGRLGVSLDRAAGILARVQTFEPSGVGARTLAECLSIQLRELNRFDPAMEALLANLPLLARRDFATLEKLCGVDAADLSEMTSEIRRLDPKPGRGFGGGPIQCIVPDVIMKAASDGSWRLELNSDALPRVLVNQTYAARIGANARSEDKFFVANCLQTANWLTKSLDQRARTILKVSSEIVRQQDAFFANGVEHLRPLNLKMVADAVGMHESTVSRVTSNKYLASPRGLFELKYFFTVSIASNTGAGAHSAEAVRFRIKQMIDLEKPEAVLSDDAIVLQLKCANVEIARRTVAKYRESMRIPSSVERRREKLARAQWALRRRAEVDFAARDS